MPAKVGELWKFEIEKFEIEKLENAEFMECENQLLVFQFLISKLPTQNEAAGALFYGEIHKRKTARALSFPDGRTQTCGVQVVLAPPKNIERGYSRMRRI